MFIGADKIGAGSDVNVKTWRAGDLPRIGYEANLLQHIEIDIGPVEEHHTFGNMSFVIRLSTRPIWYLAGAGREQNRGAAQRADQFRADRVPCSAPAEQRVAKLL